MELIFRVVRDLTCFIGIPGISSAQWSRIPLSLLQYKQILHSIAVGSNFSGLGDRTSEDNIVVKKRSLYEVFTFGILMIFGAEDYILTRILDDDDGRADGWVYVEIRYLGME